MAAKNVLVLGLSTYNERNEGAVSYYYYNSPMGRIEVSGSQTYEPVARMLVEMLSLESNTLDRVVMLCTEDANRRAVEDFKEKLCAVCGEGIEFVSVDVKNIMESEDEVFNACSRVAESIPEGARVYLDVTGGFRDSAMLLTSAMQMIKGRDLSIMAVYYVNFFFGSTKENPCQILNRTGVYKVFDLVSGLNELLKSGSVTTIEEFFADKSLSDFENNILSALTRVSQEIRMCRIEQSKKMLVRLRCALEKYDEKTSNGLASNDLFKNVVEKAREKYALLLDNRNVTFADFVEWSFKNKDYSQALAYFYEKIPVFFIETGLIYPGESLKRQLMEGEGGKLLGNERSWQQRFLKPKKPEDVKNGKFDELRQYYDRTFSTDRTALAMAKIPEDIKRYFRECLNLRDVIAQRGGDLRRAEEFWQRAGLSDIFSGFPSIAYCDKGSPHNNIFLNKAAVNNYFGIKEKAWSAEDLSCEELAELMISRVDGVEVFSNNIELARLLVEDYYYFTRQRHNVMHASGVGDLPTTIIKRLEASIERLRQV